MDGYGFLRVGSRRAKPKDLCRVWSCKPSDVWGLLIATSCDPSPALECQQLQQFCRARQLLRTTELVISQRIFEIAVKEVQYHGYVWYCIINYNYVYVFYHWIMIGFWVAKFQWKFGDLCFYQFCFFFFVTVKAHLCVFEIRMFAAEKPVMRILWMYSPCASLETTSAMDFFPNWLVIKRPLGAHAGGQLAEDLRSSLRRRWVDLNIREELHVLYIWLG